MKNYYSPVRGVKVKPRSSISSEHFLKSINKLASRDSFSPCEEVATKVLPSSPTVGVLPRGQFKNDPHSKEKICTRCDVPLAINTNITEYRFKTHYYICSSCFSQVHKEYNKKRAKVNKKAFSIDKRREELQRQIRELMDELAYLNEASRYS